MTQTKKLWTALIAALAAIVLIFAGGITANASGTGKITITPPENTASTTTNTYKIYKVFDADGDGTNIRYTLPEGKSIEDSSDMAKYFGVDNAGNVTVKDDAKDANGNLTEDAVKAIKSWLNITAADTKADYEATSKGTTAATVDNVANGYYYITTSTGSVVMVDSANADISVKDKATVPTVDKKISKVDAGSVDSDGKAAIAQVGTTVQYESTITVGNGAKNYKFKDQMSKGLSLDESSVTVKKGNDTATEDTDYTLTKTDASGDNGDSFVIDFKDDYEAGLSTGDTIVITYSAKVTSAALQTDPATNSATIGYGDTPDTTYTTAPNPPKVYNAKITVDKKFKDGTTDKGKVAGATFVLKKDGKYYQESTDADGNTTVSWVDSESDATDKTTTAESNTLDFTGLPDGSYTLVETATPSGYTRAADTTVTVKAATESGATESTNLTQTAEITNNLGNPFPITGGMGTAIFYIIGAALIVGAIVYSRKRKKA